MKSILTSAILVASVAAAPSPLLRRASGPDSKSMDELAPLIKPSAIIDVEPITRQTAKRQLIRYGPFNLPAAQPRPMNGTGHSHGGETGGIMGGGPGGFGSLNIWPVLRGDIPLAIAQFLAKSLDPEGFNVMHTVREGICKDCTVLTAKMDAVFENGTRADVSSGVYLHHIVTMNIGDRKMDSDLINTWMPFCAGSDMAMSLAQGLQNIQGFFGAKSRAAIFGFGAVDEFRQMWTTPDGKFDSGFYLAKDDKLMLQAEIVNYRKEAQQLWLQADVEWVPGKVGRSAYTTIGSATACDEPLGFTGNGTAGSKKSKGVTIKEDGNIIAARGHMHDGGDSMIVYVNDKNVCISNATYGTSYTGELANNGKKWTTISKMSDCSNIIPVKKGDVIKLEATYNEKEHPLRESDGMAQMEMGLVAFTFVSDKTT